MTPAALGHMIEEGAIGGEVAEGQVGGHLHSRPQPGEGPTGGVCFNRVVRTFA